MPENASEPAAVSLSIRRDAGAAADPDASLRLTEPHKGVLTVLIDGRQAATLSIREDEAVLSGAQGAALVRAIARGGTMEVRLGTKVLARPSLAGSGAALRYMDARQGRAGTVTALIAGGPLAASAVKAAPSLPVIKSVPIVAGVSAPPLWREELARAGKLAGCTEEMDQGPEVERHPLSRTQTLVLIPCGSGAYNMNSVPLIATGIAGRRTFTVARFDFAPGFAVEAGPAMLVNAGFEPARLELSSYAKGRGIGDCGSAETYVWDGAMFRLIDASAMGECRGAWKWITTWRATVLP